MMRKSCYTLAVIAGLFCFHRSHAFQVDSTFQAKKNKIETRIYNTQRIQSTLPVIDGKLDDKCWEEGAWAGEYRQYMPVEGAKPSQKTELKLLYDDKNIYVAIRAYDNEPEKIDRLLGRRDTYIGDIVGVCFDSYFDYRTGFEFDLTAAGGKLDVLLLNDHWDTNWDAVWYGKTGKEDSAWTAEMQIPLSQLRYGNKESHVWGLHGWRWINRNQEEDQWNLMPRDNPGFLYSIGELHGIEGIKKNRRIEFLPYTVGKVKTYKKDNEDPYSDGFDPGLSLGIDGKIGVSSNFTIDYTINPDFGQVEADPSELNLSVFETYFEEKRPFFLEGSNIFNYTFSDNRLFYSRRIGHSPSYKTDDLDSNEYYTQPDNTTILGALKLSGKTKSGLSIGLIETVTSNEYIKISQNNTERKELSEPPTNYLIGRLQQDINQSNTIIGGMFTATNRDITEEQMNFISTSAYTGGLDLRHHWKDKTYYFDAKTFGSYISGDEEAMLNLQEASARYFQRDDASHLTLDSSMTSMTGYGGSVETGKASNGKWRFYERFTWRSPGLELNDLGYMQTADALMNGTLIKYVVDKPAWKFRSYSLELNQENFWDFSGKYLNSGFYFSFNSFTENKFNITVNLNRITRVFDTRLLRGGPGFYLNGFLCQYYRLETDVSKKIVFRTDYHIHLHDDGLSYTNDLNSGMDFRIANILQLSPGISLSWQKDGFHYVDKLGDDTNERFILAELKRKIVSLTFKANLAITPEMTIQYYFNPYFSSGKYSKYKLVTTPGQKTLENQYQMLQQNVDYVISGDDLVFGNALIGTGENITENPDFYYFESHSNLVFRWEYKPGSTLYFVWTQSGLGEEKLSHETPEFQNIFLIKLNYWFSL